MLALALASCATTNPQNPLPRQNQATTLPKAPPIVPPELDLDPVPDAKPKPTPTPKLSVPAPTPKPTNTLTKPPAYESLYGTLKYWQNTDPRPALAAFQNTCKSWDNRGPEKWMHPSHKRFGQIKDWRPACRAASHVKGDFPTDAVHFFQTHFEPISVSTRQPSNLLTGYYAPEIEVRKNANTEFNAPLLARPSQQKIQNLPRSALSAKSSDVLAYGRRIEVFFLQIQGSGRIKFKDGSSFMAAYNGHNGHVYKSIGRVLIKNGELEKDAVSKQAIENWMGRAGPMAAQELMNSNPRYIFFKLENIKDGVGPKGAAGIALTSLGSLAIDPRYLPYGLPIWLETKLPVQGGDFDGEAAGLLVITQDTGSAIKGEWRGDLYFGIGEAAGAKAGVMKHKALWTVLLPTALAIKIADSPDITAPKS